MSDWNLELPRHKAERRSPVPESAKLPAKRKKREARPYRVMYRWPRKMRDDGLFAEYVAHRAQTREAAQAWIDKQARSAFVPFRTAPAAYKEDAVRRAKERAARYYIVGPGDYWRGLTQPAE